MKLNNELFELIGHQMNGKFYDFILCGFQREALIT